MKTKRLALFVPVLSLAALWNGAPPPDMEVTSRPVLATAAQLPFRLEAGADRREPGLAGEPVMPVAEEPTDSASASTTGGASEPRGVPAVLGPGVPAGLVQVAEPAASAASAAACAPLKIDFLDNELLATDGRRTTELFDIAPTCTTYEVVLISEDPRHTLGWQPWQTDERWRLEALDDDGSVLWATDSTDDLPETDRLRSQTMGVFDLSSVRWLRGVHAWAGTSDQSVHVRAELRPIGGVPTPDVCGETLPGLTVEIEQPASRATIDLGATPLFDLRGSASVPAGDAVSRIDVLADGVVVGQATIDLLDPLAPERRWVFETSAPPGEHTVSVCVRSTSGHAASATVTLNVMEPLPAATVVWPDVVVAEQALLDSLIEITSSTITFARLPATVTVGDVLVVGVTDRTPSGLARRLGAAHPIPGGVRFDTTEAPLDELFLEAHVALPEPAEDGATASAASVRTALASTASTSIDATADSAETRVISPTLEGCEWGDQPTADGPTALVASCTVELQRSAQSPPDPDAVATGDVSITGRLTATGVFQPILSIDVAPEWRWGRPLSALVTADVGLQGTLNTTASLTFDGSGSIKATTELVAPHDLRPFPIPGLPIPLVVVPVVSVDGTLSTTASLSLSAEATAGLTSRVSAHWDGEQWTNTSSSDVVGEGQLVDVAGSGSLEHQVLFVPRAAFLLNGVAGPEVSLGVGPRVRYQAPCPGFDASLVVVPGLRGAVRESLEDLDRWLEKLDTQLSSDLLTFPLVTVSPESCLSISSTQLPVGIVGVPYEAELSAVGGLGPYSWVVDGLPAGLSVSDDGVVSGRPTTAGSFPVTIAVADGRGTTRTIDTTVEILPPPPPVPGQAVGRSNGDPHQTTFDGLRYDFQAAGDFILFDSIDDDLEAQVRQRFTRADGPKTATLIAEMAVRTPGGQVVRFAGNIVTVDGQAAKSVMNLVGGAVLTTSATVQELTLADGTTINSRRRGTFMDVTVWLAPVRNGRVVGLLGDADGNRAGDLSTRDQSLTIDGTELRRAAVEEAFYGEFGPSWVVGESERLLSAPGVPYQRPEKLVVSTIDAVARGAATQTCLDAGWTEANGLADCVFDLLASDDPGAADPAGQVPSAGTTAAANVPTMEEFGLVEAAGRLVEAVPIPVVFDQAPGSMTFLVPVSQQDIAGGIKLGISQSEVSRSLSGTGTIDVYAPSGEQVGHQFALTSNLMLVTRQLSEPGVYRVTIKPHPSVTGSLSVRLFASRFVVGQLEAARPGGDVTPVDLSLPEPAQEARFSIAVSPEDVANHRTLAVRLTGDLCRDISVSCWIVSPSGDFVSHLHDPFASPERALIVDDLPEAGTYQLLIEKIDQEQSKSGSVSARLVNPITATLDPAASSNAAQSVTIRVTEVGQRAVLTVAVPPEAAGAGRSLTIRTTRDAGLNGGWFAVHQPSGATPSYFLGSTIPIPLAASGDYVIEILPDGRTGTADISVFYS